MDQATLARATGPFFSTKDVGKGTGLGLSMIHGLVAQSGGTLSLTSAPGEGTAVGLWLPPRDDVADTVSRDERQPIAAPRAATLVLVDDEELVRTATAGMLRDIGYSAIEFGSANQALGAFRTGTEAGALVTDDLMPGMTGGALVSELRGIGHPNPLASHHRLYGGRGRRARQCAALGQALPASGPGSAARRTDPALCASQRSFAGGGMNAIEAIRHPDA